MDKLKRISAKFKPLGVAVFTLELLTLLPAPALAFYQWQNEPHSIEATGLLRVFGMALQNPDNTSFYSQHEIINAGFLARLMLAGKWDDVWSLEVHAEQGYVPKILQTGGSRFATNITGVERSDALAWTNLERQASLQFDRLNLQYYSKKLTVKIGRQPLSLASTFFFTPNDFFSPFAAQVFFRNYKAGVDAARADVQLGQFSQLSLISVLGYSRDLHSDSGWRSKPALDRTSYLARLSTVVDDFQWAVLGGRVRKNNILGVDFQGEVFEWLGVRGEGHVNFSTPASLKNSVEFALSLEHRWENTFTLRLEQFYHGSGANSANTYLNNLLTNINNTDRLSLYLAKLYTAVGVSYEITPLLTGNATYLFNGVDNSSLLALYANYSVSDESELALSINLPFGRKPDNTCIKDEFGLSPRLMSLEYRLYF